MNTTPKRGPTAANFNTQSQRDRRKFFREVGAMADDMLRAMGFTPAERRAQMAISMRLYEYANEAPDKPRQVSLISIGGGLTSRSDDDEACKQQAIRHVGHLFNHAIPRTGYQTHTRYKAEEGSNKAHEYVDHIVPVASFFGELLSEEIKTILADKGIDKSARRAKIEETRASIIVEALSYMPKCEAVILEPDGETTYAYVSGPEAKAYCAKNPDYAARAYQYVEPEPETKPKRPLYAEDFDRIEGRIHGWIEDELEGALSRNSFDEARHFAARLQVSIQKRIASWVKVAGATGWREKEEENLYTGDKSDMGADADDLSREPVLPVENSTEDETEPGDNLSPGQGVNSFADNADENDYSKTDPVENFSEPEPERGPELTGSENFDTSLEAAISYVRDGWAIVPCCQFDPATGRCTGPDSHHDDGMCKGKVPLIKGKKPTPGAGYTAATRDKGLIRDWFTRQFPDAGVAIRLDGHILIDCDVKDGAPGLESYQILADTFDLPSTLSAVTPSGGRHHIFKLPDDLPADFLGSWTRVLDSAELGGIDIKVNNKGLAHVEPTVGKTGIYRWIDPTADIAELPRAVCDYLHEVHERQQQPQASVSADAQPFDPDEDQAKYFKDMPNGQRRPRLRGIACCLASGGANEQQIVSVLNYHDGRFTEPTNDAKFIARVASGAVLKYGQGVSQ